MLLSSEQYSIVDQIVELIKTGTKKILLDAPAGTGKTTLCLALSKNFKDVQFIAPTHKSKNILQSKLPKDYTVKTICSFLTGVPNYDSNGKKRFLYTPSKNSKKVSSKRDAKIIIVEECSMVKEEEFRKLIAVPGVSFIFIGDHSQLPPVEDTDKIAEESSCVFKYVPTKLTLIKILRSDIPEILDVHNLFRTEIPRQIEESNYVRVYSSEFQLFRDFLKKPDRKCILTYHNKTCEYYNREIRNIIYDTLSLQEEFISKEPFIFYDYYEANRNPLLTGALKLPWSFKLDEPIKTLNEEYKEYTNTVRNVLDIQKRKLTVTFEDKEHTFDIYFINNCLTYVRKGWKEFDILVRQKISKKKDASLWKLYYDHFAFVQAPIRHVYSQTVYRAQSDTIENVFVDMKDMLSAKYLSEQMLQKCLYTAVSRSSHFIGIYK